MQNNTIQGWEPGESIFSMPTNESQTDHLNNPKPKETQLPEDDDVEEVNLDDDDVEEGGLEGEEVKEADLEDDEVEEGSFDDDELEEERNEMYIEEEKGVY